MIYNERNKSLRSLFRGVHLNFTRSMLTWSVAVLRQARKNFQYMQVCNEHCLRDAHATNCTIDVKDSAIKTSSILCLMMNKEYYSK